MLKSHLKLNIVSFLKHDCVYIYNIVLKFMAINILEQYRCKKKIILQNENKL